MGHANGRITEPVNTDDVMAVLGIASHNVGYLCSDSNGATKKINMWAKYKPEAIGTQATLSLESRKNNNFGLEPAAKYTGKAAFIAAVNNKSFTGGWNYKRVSPYIFNADGTIKSGRGDWARLDDFVGYNANATSPFGTIYPFRAVLTSNTNNHVVIPLDAPADWDGTTDEGFLSIKDFSKGGLSLKDWYFGVLLVSKTNTSRTFIVTTTSPIGTNENWQADFGYIAPTYAGTYTAVPFLSSKPYTVSGAEQSGSEIVGIGSPGVDVELVSITALYQFVLNCTFIGDTNTVNYDLNVVNNDTTTKSWSNVKIYVATSSSGANSVEVASLGTISVGSKLSVTKSGSKVLSSPLMFASNYYTHCRVTFTGASSSDQQWVPIDQFDPDDSVFA